MPIKGFGVVLLNTPIGYTKNPLVTRESGRRNDAKKEKQTSSDPSTRNSRLAPSSLGGISLDKLPFEIRFKIANELSQIDCLSLLITNSAMYQSTMPRLYQHIIVDEAFTQFSKEYEYRYYKYDENFQELHTVSCSYVNSPYTFKKLLKSYNHMCEHKRLDMFPHIRFFQVIKLPDSINTYDYELNEMLTEFFSNLDSLQELVWMNDNFKLKYLKVLPNPDAVVSLMLNIKFSNYLSELNDTPLSVVSSHDSAHSYHSMDSLEESKFNFPNLIKFHIKPFENLKRIVKIMNNLLIGDDSNIATRLEKLVTLKLARFEKEMNVLVPPAADLIVSRENLYAYRDLDVDTIGSTFLVSKLGRLNNLTNLCINNCLLTSSDGDTLINSIDLTKLVRLRLQNISEYQKASRTSTGSLDPKPSVLSKIAPHLKNLRHLYLDYREAVVDSVPEFLVTIPGKLVLLDLTIRYNDTKRATYTTNELFDAYSKAVVYKRQKTLKSFAIDIKEENAFCDITLSVPGTFFYRDLAGCKKLQSLRMNPSDKSDELAILIAQLPQLKVLDVFGAKAGGAPHLGLGAVHPNVYDEWFKVQHVAMIYGQCNEKLQYIRVNKCIFECSRQGQFLVNPRDGIDRWFDQMVRVD